MKPDTIKDLRRDNANLQKQLAARDKQLHEMWEDFTTLSASHERWEKEAEEARLDADELRRLNALLESQCNSLGDEIHIARRETLLARKEAQDVQHEIRAIEEELWHVKEEGRVARDDAEQAKADAERLKEEVRQLRAVLSADTEIDKMLVLLETSIESGSRSGGSDSDNSEQSE